MESYICSHCADLRPVFAQAFVVPYRFWHQNFFAGKDKDLKIGNIRFAFLGGKLALHNVQYVSKNVLVRVQRLVMTFRWWAPVYRKEERWVMDREDSMSHSRHNHPNSRGGIQHQKWSS